MIFRRKKNRPADWMTSRIPYGVLVVGGNSLGIAQLTCNGGTINMAAFGLCVVPASVGDRTEVLWGGDDGSVIAAFPYTWTQEVVEGDHISLEYKVDLNQRRRFENWVLA